MSEPTPNLPAVQTVGQSQMDVVREALGGILGPDDAKIATNIPLDQTWGKSLASKCKADECVELKDAHGQVWPIRYWLIHVVPVEIDGEIHRMARVVLCTPEGKRLAWTGASTTRYFVDLLCLAGLGPYEPPLMVRVHRGTSRKEHRGNYYPLSIEVPTDQQLDEAKAHKAPKK